MQLAVLGLVFRREMRVLAPLFVENREQEYTMMQSAVLDRIIKLRNLRDY